MKKTSIPERVAIIGGGRWARVLLSVVCDLVPSSTIITIHTAHNKESMKNWLKERKLDLRVGVYSEYPQFDKKLLNACIVVNQARDHKKAIEWSLQAGTPVVTEKPVTLSALETERLIKLASEKNIAFASAHIFLFNRNIENFKKMIKGEILSIKIHWNDPRTEVRYGEDKKYDSSLSIFADHIPHVISVLQILMPDINPVLISVETFKGGAQQQIKLSLENINCSVELIRDGHERKREIEVITSQGKFVLNFAKEPGEIITENLVLTSDPEWESGKKPSESMLLSFFNWICGGEFDSRLSTHIGLRANKLIDEINSQYQPALIAWLIDNITLSQGKFGDEICYALRERLQAEKTLSTRELEVQIDEIMNRYNDKIFLFQLLGKKDKTTF